MTREGELDADTEAVQRWIAAPDEAHRCCRGTEAPNVVVVLARPQRDVVPEPLRLLVGVGMAADVDEQRRVVDRRAFGVAEFEAIGEAQRDHALPQHVLHRLPEAEIDAQRQGRDELREPYLRHRPTMDHGGAEDLL